MTDIAATSEGGLADLEPLARPESGMRGVARQTALYGLGMLLAKGLGFFMLPVYTRFLTPADYGVMELINMTLDVVMIIAGAQMVGGVYRFYHKAETWAERREVVSTAFILFALSFGILGLAAVALAPMLSTLIFGTDVHTLTIRVAGATVALGPTIMVPQAYLRVRNEAGVFVTSNLVKLLLAAALNVVLLVLGWGVLSIFVSGLVATLLVGGGLTLRMLRQTGVRLSTGAMRNLLRYGIPLVFTNIATFLFTFGDRFFLQAAGDETTVGLYMMAYQFGFLLIMIGSGPFDQVWSPRRFEIARREDRDLLFSQGFLYSNLMLLSVAAGLLLFIEDFFRVMTTPAFYPAAQFVPLIVVAYIFQAWVGVQDIGLLVKERTEFVAVANWIAAAAALLGYALLVPRFLAWGAAWTTLGTMFLRWVLIFSASQRVWYVRYTWRPVLKLAALATGLVISGYLLPKMPILPSVLVRATLYSFFLLLVWHSGILGPEERISVKNRVQRVLNRLRFQEA